MRTIIFDFFNDNKVSWLSNFCEYFNLDKFEVEKYFKNVNLDTLTADVIIETFGINLNLHDSSKVKIVCRHMTTSTEEGLKSFKEKGLLDLKGMLQLDTPISEFLSHHKIWIDVDNKSIKIKDKVYPILSYGDVCGECFMNKSVKCIGYSKCDLMEKTEDLARKLYRYGATVECFIHATIEEMKRYSTVERYPEILETLENICSSVPNNYTKHLILSNEWAKEKRKCYVMEYASKLSQMETYAPIDYNANFREYGKCIVNSGYDYDDYLERNVPQQVFDNMIFIQWFLSIYFHDSEILGSLLTNKCVPADEIRIMEIKDRKLKYMD